MQNYEDAAALSNHRILFLLSAGLIAAVSAAAASGQTAIPASLRTASSISDSDLATIRAYVAEMAGKLADPDPDVVRGAREGLVDGARAGAQPPSPAYALRYAEIANTELLRVLGQKQQPIRTSLNAAVAAARIAEICQNGKLEGMALKLLDPAQHTVLRLWGAKTAKSVLPHLIAVGGHARLLGALIKAVNDMPGGAMTQEAYEALTRNPDKKAVEAVADTLLDLARARIDAYRTEVPEDAQAEVIVFSYLLKDCWNNPALTLERRRKTVQMLVDLLTYAAFRGDRESARRDELVGLVDKLCQLTAVAASVSGWKELEADAIKAFRDVRVGGAKLQDAIKPVVANIRKLKDYSGIAEPDITALTTAKP